MVKFRPNDDNYDIVRDRLLGLVRRIARPDPSQDALNSQLPPAKRQQLIKLLPFDQIDARINTVKKHAKNTCSWIRETPEYKSWRDPAKRTEHHGFWWIRGKPGAGKSVLMKYLCHNSEKTIRDAKVIRFFFHARGDILERSTLGLYRSLLFQIFQLIPDLQIALDTLGLYHTKKIEQEGWQIQPLQKALLQSVKRLGSHQLICYVDALDECPEEQVREMVRFFERLGEKAMSHQASLSICFSSRHYPHITIDIGLKMELEQQKNHEVDIERYIDTELRIHKSPFAEKAKEGIIEKASGVFLWVALVIPMLNEAFDRGNIRALKRRLQELPASLSDLFLNMLERDTKQKDALLCCIQWVLFSKSQLDLITLHSAINTALEDDLDDWSQEDVTDEIMLRYIIAVSKGLVEKTVSKAPTMQFIHESVRDFFLKDKGFQKLWPELSSDFEAKGHQSLAHHCRKQITATSLNKIEIPSPLPPPAQLESTRSRFTSAFPFLRHAVDNILYHSNMAQEYGESQATFVKDFPKAQWIAYHNLFEKYQTRRYPENISLLYILAEQDLSQLVRISPDRIRHLQIKEGRYGNPLLAALAHAISTSMLLNFYLAATALSLAVVGAAAPDYSSRPCGFKIAPCPEGTVCKPNERDCIDLNRCAGTCVPRIKPPKPPVVIDPPLAPRKEYISCGGKRVTPVTCPKGTVCQDDPRNPDSCATAVDSRKKLRKFIPGAYIFEFEDGQDTGRFRSQVEPEGETRLHLNFELFKGISVQFNDADNAEETVARLASLPAIKNVWPIELHDGPELTTHGPNEGFEARRSNSLLRKRQDNSTSEPYAPHVMAQVDKMHAKGITGKGVKIAIIDSGVDHGHPYLGGCFGENCLVAFGHDFVGDAYTGGNTPVPDEDPMDCHGHGTHVAGIIAAQKNELGFYGVAPDAILGAYRVFGCDGGVTDDVLLAAFNKAYEDGADIITASIGGSSGWSSELLASAVGRIVQQGVACTVSAGNDGYGGLFEASSPAAGKGVAAIASYENTHMHRYAAEGFYGIDNGPRTSFFFDGYQFQPRNGSLSVWVAGLNSSTPFDPCVPLPEDTPDLAGYTVLLEGGDCTVTEQVLNVLEKGGRSLVIYKDVDYLPQPFASEGRGIARRFATEMEDNTGPAAAEDEGMDSLYSIHKEVAGQWIAAAKAGSEVKVTFPDLRTAKFKYVAFPETLLGGAVSDFTSWGPTFEMNFKPQFGAPGGGILSTLPRDQGGHGIASGTSMSCPFVAGAYALLAEVAGSLDPVLIENALAATAKPQVFTSWFDWQTWLAPPAQQGAGMIQVYDAAFATARLDVSGLSFNDTDNFAESLQFTLSNTGSDEVTYEISHVPTHTFYTLEEGSERFDTYPNEDTTAHAELAFSRSSVTIGPGDSVTIEVVATPPVDVDVARLPLWSGYIAINGSDSTSYSLPYQGLKASLHDAANVSKRGAFVSSTYNIFTPISSNTTFTFPPPGTEPDLGMHDLALISQLNLGSPKVTFDIFPHVTCPTNSTVKASIEPIGQPVGYPRHWVGKGDWWEPWYGQLSTGEYIPAGRYKVISRVLRIFGDESDEEDWVVYESNPFHIRYEH
ncbi:Minor extracellular protease vpr [Paramyrothecium foliicola]|nr:Minor extracellular protease vpr [Paramyrothecium foliicola]